MEGKQTKRRYGLGIIGIILAVMFAMIMPFAVRAEVEDIPIDEDHFPDASFRGYILDKVDDGDQILTTEEISNVTEMTVSEKGIKSLKGIQYFTSLVYLECAYNELTELDVSGLTELQNFYISENPLERLDASGCKKLVSIKFDGPYYVELKELKLSGCTGLTELDCYNNQLKELDVSGCTELVSLNCKKNPLERLDASGCKKLVSIDVLGEYFDYGLKELKLSGCTSLTALNCCDNQLTELDVSGCTGLTSLKCSGNQLTELDVSGCTGLSSLDCSSNKLSELDVSGCTALEELDCDNNQLTELDVSGCTGLSSLHCWENQLTELDVSGCTGLTSLSCSNNQINELDVSKCTQLEIFYCKVNQLTELDIKENKSLISFSCGSNHVTSIDLSHCPDLQELYVFDTDIEELDLSLLPELRVLECERTKLNSVDLSYNSKLETLYCEQNNLTELDLSHNPLVTTIICYNNKIKAVNVTGMKFPWCDEDDSWYGGTLYVAEPVYKGAVSDLDTVFVDTVKKKAWKRKPDDDDDETIDLWSYYYFCYPDGWVTMGDKTYYINGENGNMLTGTQIIDGKEYGFTEDGELYMGEYHEHSWDDGVVSKPATCVENGIRLYTCTGCEETKTEVIPATGHTEVIDDAVAPTCTKTGLTEGSHCSVCGEVIKVQEKVPATKHSWDAGKVTKAATCTKTGVKTFTCKNCGEIKTETIKATGHKEVKDPAVAATFTRKGKTAGSHCSVCGTVIKKQTVIAMKTGLNKVSGKTYFYKDGKKQSGWQSVGNKKYYFDKKTKVMVTGKVKIGTKYYYFDTKTGVMKTGKIKVGKKYYYFSTAKKTLGKMQTGWVKISKKYYYFSKTKKTLGQMVTGKLKIGKKVYKFNAKGVCLNR